ncbi:MAG: gliding motility-associated C-terminal domain-containing protein [Saprospiraceae bacterium]|nr:gliding motility-associated C-terminal domain-containing protein [Saprospiraceae bacterium]
MLQVGKSLQIILVLLIGFKLSYSQERVPNSLSVKVKGRSPQKTVQRYQLFSPEIKPSRVRNQTPSKKLGYLNLHQLTLQTLRSSDDSLLELEIPFEQQTLILQIYQQTPLTLDFQIETPLGNYVPQQKGQHYRGIIKDDDQSVVAISIFEEDIMGLISTAHLGTLVLARVPSDSLHIVCRAEDLYGDNSFQCEALLKPGYEVDFTGLKNAGTQGRSFDANCVKIYFETSYNVYQRLDKNVEKVINYVSGVFNQVSALYTNDEINLEISGLFVWTEQDPYDHESTTAALNSFMNRSPGGDSNLRHLLDMADNKNGGIAYIDVICDQVLNVGYSNILPAYVNFPNYSWTVNVIAHELGHGMGSFHTQDCVWGPDNCIALDGCSKANPEIGCGVCDIAPIPPKGTIMSYCHLKGGIDFSLGFGEEPGNLIRRRVSEASCLTPCGSSFGILCALSIDTALQVDASCGENNGQLSIQVSGASGSQTYDIGYGPQASQFFGDLSPGKYQILVRDGIGCTRSTSILVTQKSGRPKLNVEVTNASCKGVDGMVRVNVLESQGPYSFQLGEMTTTDSIFVKVSPGIYEVIVNDAQGCVVSKQFQVFEESPPMLSLTTESTHCGQANGLINLHSLGGTSPFEYWVGGSLFDTTLVSNQLTELSDLDSGLYRVVVRDSNSCKDSAVVHILPSELPTLTARAKPASCDQKNGSIILLSSGGTEPYEYMIDGEEYTDSIVSDLDRGIYRVSLKDADRCEVSREVEVGYDSSFLAPQFPPMIDLCAGEKIKISPNLAPATNIIWKREAVSIINPVQDLSIDEPGTYKATAVYADDCMLSTTTEVVLREMPDQEWNPTVTICAGEPFQLTSPKNDYTYSWSQGSNGSTAIFQESGEYELRVQNTFGCQQTLYLSLSLIEPVRLKSMTELFVCPGSEVMLQVSGADTYRWFSKDSSLIERDIANPIIVPTQEFDYLVIGKNSCFADTLVVPIGIYKRITYLPLDTQVVAGSRLDLKVENVSQVQWHSEYELSCQRCLNTSVIPDVSNALRVSYVDFNGCFWEDTIQITVTDFADLLPPLINVITPNDDGKNDYLIFGDPNRVFKMSLEVFNHDGTKLYESRPYENDWNGFQKGNPLPEGVYFYVLTLEYEDRIIRMDSDLTIIRH